MIKTIYYSSATKNYYNKIEDAVAAEAKAARRNFSPTKEKEKEEETLKNTTKPTKDKINKLTGDKKAKVDTIIRLGNELTEMRDKKSLDYYFKESLLEAEIEDFINNYGQHELDVFMTALTLLRFIM